MLAGIGLLAACLTTFAADVYVLPTGNDRNPGTRDKPLATLEAARDAVRAQIARGEKANITVFIGPGNYFVEKPIVLDDRDGAPDGVTITYRGAPNLATRIYGGRRITGWTKNSDGSYQVNVPDLQTHKTLYENDEAANGGAFHTFAGENTGNWRREGTKLSYFPRNLPIENQVIVLGTALDVFRIEGRSMTQIAQNIVFDGLHMIGSGFNRWRTGSDDYSKWDKEYDGRIWDGSPLVVIAPDLRHGQFYVENARRITIKNSKLYGAGHMAAMFNRWAQENVVENNWIEDAGCSGLYFLGWECGRGPFKSVAESYVNKKNTVRNNVFYDIGRFAWDSSGVFMEFSGDNVVMQNIFRGSRRYGVSLKGWRTRLINEWTIISTPLKAQRKVAPFDEQEIKLYGEYVVTEENQGSAVQHSRNNKVGYNDFSQIPRTGDDLGMIEMWGAGPGNAWMHNALHDGVNVAGENHWMHVLFNDDASHNASLIGNIIYWVRGGIRSRAIASKGINQVNKFNIIADSIFSHAATVGPYGGELAYNMVWSNNIIAAQIQSRLAGGGGSQKVGGKDYPLLKECDNNLYYYVPFGPAESDETAGKELKGSLRTSPVAGGGTANDAHSVYADPRFDRKRPWWAVTYQDYLLKPDSPALKMGFVQTDMSRIGVTKDYPFPLTEVLGHPAGENWKAANYDRLYKCNIADEKLVPAKGDSFARDAWVRYQDVDFGKGEFKQFRAKVDWAAPRRTFVKKIDGEPFYAVESGTSYVETPYWEVSPVYHVKGKTGPELFDVAFDPETKPESVKWKAITQPLVSRQTEQYPLGVVNLDVANGEENANGAAYMRSSFFSNGSGKRGVEVSGNHGLRIWANGKEVFAQLGGVNKKKVDMEFKKGWNTLVVKVVQDEKPWQTYRGNGNFWASLKIFYAAMGGAYILPGLPGEEVFIQPDKGPAIELRLGAPDGKVIGSLPLDAITGPIEKVTGRHDLFFTFPKENVKMIDWYRFEK